MVHESSQAGAAPPPRARRREANLERILDAALTLVADGGLEALHMATLAAAVDYTPGALYRYLPSKDALVARLVTRTVDQVAAALTATAAAAPARATPLARVGALVAAYHGYARREPHAFGLLASALAAPRILVADAADARAIAVAVVAALTPLAAALTAAVEAEQLATGDATERTLCLFALVHGLAQLPKLGRAAPVRLDVAGLIAAGTRTLLIGWGATPRAADSAAARITEPS